MYVFLCVFKLNFHLGYTVVIRLMSENQKGSSFGEYDCAHYSVQRTLKMPDDGARGKVSVVNRNRGK